MGLIDSVAVNVGGNGSIINTLSTYITKVLKPNIINGKNVLIQEMMPGETGKNTKYVIKYDYDLNEESVTIPEGCLIEFDGGSISNGTIIFNDTILIYDQQEEDVLKNVTMLGNYEVSAGGKGNKKDNTNGMGKIYLKKSKGFAEQLTQDNTIYVIQYDFDLNDPEGEHPVTIPENCVLQFEGGSLRNGFINLYNLLSIESPLFNTIFIDVDIVGAFSHPMILHTSWFGIKDGVNCDAIFAKLLNYCRTTTYSSQYTELVIDTDITLYRPIEANVHRAVIRGLSSGKNRNNHMGVTIKSDYQPQNGEESLIKLTGVGCNLIDLSFLWNIDQNGRNNILELMPQSYGHGDEATIDLDCTISNCWFRTFWDTTMIKATGRGLLVTDCIFSNSHRDNYGTFGNIECYSTHQNLNDKNGSYLEDQMRAIIIKNNRFHSGPGHYCLLLGKGEEENTSPFKGVEFVDNYCDRGNGFVCATTEDVQGMIITNNTSLFLTIGSLVRLNSFKGVIIANNDIQGSGRESDTSANARPFVTTMQDENTKQQESLIIANNHYYRADALNAILNIVGENNNSPISSVIIECNSFVKCFQPSNSYNCVVYCQRAISINNLSIQNNVFYDCPDDILGLRISPESSINTKEYKNITVDKNLGIKNSIKIYNTVNAHVNDPVKYQNVIVGDLQYRYVDGKYVEYDGAPKAVNRNGIDTNMPVDVYQGFSYFNSSVEKPMWFDRETTNNRYWVDAEGSLTSIDKNSGTITYPLKVGEGNNRPSGDYVKLGYVFWNNTTDRAEFYTSNSPKTWKEFDGVIARVKRSGTFEQKPTTDNNLYIGFRYFCTDKQTPEQAAISVNLKGVEIIYKGQDTTDPNNPVDVWVDALGRVVS